MESSMALFVCSNCGYEKEARCKPKECPKCGKKNTFEKEE
jgi:rubrerythrin